MEKVTDADTLRQTLRKSIAPAETVEQHPANSQESVLNTSVLPALARSAAVADLIRKPPFAGIGRSGPALPRI